MRTLERKKRAEEHIDSEGSWAISYGDMITLLLSFFVLYFTVDHQKVKANQVQEALMVKLLQSGVKAANDGLKTQINLGQQPGEGVEPTMMQKLGAQVFQHERSLVVDFQNISFFNFGQIDVNKDGQKALEEFVAIYLPFAGMYTLKIQAYTDTRGVRSTNPRFRDNLELSALRSVSAMRVLQKAGLPLRNLKIAGLGELIDTQERIMASVNETDPQKYSRKVVLVIEPARERN